MVILCVLARGTRRFVLYYFASARHFSQIRSFAFTRRPRARAQFRFSLLEPSDISRLRVSVAVDRSISVAIHIRLMSLSPRKFILYSSVSNVAPSTFLFIRRNDVARHCRAHHGIGSSEIVSRNIRRVRMYASRKCVSLLSRDTDGRASAARSRKDRTQMIRFLVRRYLISLSPIIHESFTRSVQRDTYHVYTTRKEYATHTQKKKRCTRPFTSKRQRYFSSVIWIIRLVLLPLSRLFRCLSSSVQ